VAEPLPRAGAGIGWPDSTRAREDRRVHLEPSALLRVYDEQLRTTAEVRGAVRTSRIGPVTVAVFPGGTGFVTYPHPGDARGRGLHEWVGDVVAHLAADPEVVDVEWKTRGHDDTPGLHAALVEHGFEPGEVESVMLGPAEGLAVDVPLPDGVTLRRATEEVDVRAASAMADRAFGDPLSDRRADDILERLGRGDGVELWVAEADGEVVGSGRLEPVPGTEVAGIWGGATLPQWRGRGIYRALTAERARSALRMGMHYLHSDSTELSRPILERSGLVPITTTTPYTWTR
jgi:N-acetylglutamate synthase-like GNAT family acetyltransferase